MQHLKIHLHLLPFLLTILCACSPTTEFEYGDAIEISGTVERTQYIIGSGDTYEAFLLILPDSIDVRPSATNPEFGWGETTRINQLHIDLDNPKIASYEGQEITISGMLRASENPHHRGAACVVPEEIEGQ